MVRNQWPSEAISGHQPPSMHLGHVLWIRLERPPIPIQRLVKFAVHLQCIGKVVGRSRVVRREAQHLMWFAIKPNQRQSGSFGERRST